ncbi:hypothetical protein FRAHR75_850023 [Frankia sp. Hr75.2]|nr:hypothetical protein FRAHR75_850023 [Frankia sp. Hr75.2]
MAKIAEMKPQVMGLPISNFSRVEPKVWYHHLTDFVCYAWSDVFGVGMYLRFTQRRNADGAVVRYAALVQQPAGGCTVKPQVLMNLGRTDRVDVDGLLRLAASIREHFGDGRDEPGGPGHGEAGRPRRVPGCRLSA